MTTKRTKGEKDQVQTYTEEEERLVSELAEMLVEGFVAIYEAERLGIPVDELPPDFDK